MDRLICGLKISLLFAFIQTILLISHVECAVNIEDYGAVGDGKTINTTFIQKAIDEVSEQGGGVVVFPAGDFVSGTIIVKDNITLHLSEGACLKGSRNGDDYPQTVPKIRSYTDNYVKQSLLYGEDVHTIAITGRGKIDGQGDAFYWKEYVGRPYVIRFINCKNILIDGITLVNSPMWMQHYLSCDDLTIQNIHVFNHGGYNNDGLDIDSCSNVRVSNCTIDSDDDALCLKSTTNQPCENITITNCVLSSHCNAFKAGTESNGGFKNITLNNTAIHSPKQSKSVYGKQRGLAGIALEIVDGGVLERVAISNIVMEGISVPLFLRLGNRARPIQEKSDKPDIGVFKDVVINNIVASNVSRIGCSITGQIQHDIENVSIQNVIFEFEGGGTSADFHQSVPEKTSAYPESTMFGVLPAYGFYVRHVDGLSLKDIQLRFDQRDERPSIVCDDVKNVQLNGLVGTCTSESIFLAVHDVQNAMIQNCTILGTSKHFLSLSGKTSNVSCINNDFSRISKPFIFETDEIEKSLYQSSNHMEK
jgi:polygalacturonase